ncbi:hypothetical protein BH10PSE13_BH10PSE13_04390 [soil metagenome]
MPIQAPDFALFFDDKLTRPTCYHAGGEYFAKARDRMDNSYALIQPYVAGKIVVDVGASPFYLLDRAKEGGAARAHGIYFANDDHPLRDADKIYSRNGPIELSHADVEVAGFPFADDEVDVVTACEILEHFDHFPTRFAMEVRRILKPGGHLFITVPNVASIGNIIKLIFQKNIYMKYRADATGRHKHEFTLAQLKAFIGYMGMDVVKAGFLPTPTSDLYALRPIYRAIAKTPGIKSYSPTLYILARQPQVKPGNDLSVPPPALFDDTQSIEA